MSGTITHEWNGTILTITSDSGTSSCDLKGAQGDTGIRGPQGAAGKGDVESVNGKIGEVVITCDNIGAATATHTHTAAEIGALPDTTVIPDAYTLPQATSSALGGVKAEEATETDTQAVRIGADGKLYTATVAGVSVSTATINESGHLIIVLSDSTVIDAGLAKGDAGATGENGATFTPSVSEEGNLSWTNDKELVNPTPVNIKGEDGAQGISVIGSTINASGHLILTLSNDTTIDAGTVVPNTVMIDNTQYTMRTGTEGAAGYITFVLE